MDGDAHERGIEREYGRPRGSGKGRIAFMVVIGVNFAFQMTRDSKTIGVVSRVVMTTLVLGVVVWRLLFIWRGRTFVAADGITARGAVRVRRTSWHDIYDIRVEPSRSQRSGDSQWFTYLYDNEGRRILLPNVDDWQLPDFGAEIDGLRDVAARHRGMTWERRPEVEALIRRRAGHRKAWVRAYIGALLVLLAMFLLLLWQVATTGVARPFLLLVCVPLAAFALLAALLNWRWESQVQRALREPEGLS